MTVRNSAPPSRFSRCEAMRQAVLDLAHKKPGVSGSEIVHTFGWPAGTANSRLVNMLALGELSREQIAIKVQDKTGRTVTLKSYAYTALVEKTVSAETVRRQKAGYAPKPEKIKVERMKSVKKPSTEIGKTRAPGHYVQKGGNWQANPDSGGQGAVQRRVVIGSVLG